MRAARQKKASATSALGGSALGGGSLVVENSRDKKIKNRENWWQPCGRELKRQEDKEQRE
jgi:hypothetical protein